MLSSCATVQRTDVFFGMNIPGGGEVTTEQWKNFSDSVVTPRFPDGYTEFQVVGRWMDTDTRHTISENSRVLTFIGRKNKVREMALDTIVQHYIHRFKQQAVLRTDSRVRVNLISSK